MLSEEGSSTVVDGLKQAYTNKVTFHNNEKVSQSIKCAVIILNCTKENSAYHCTVTAQYGVAVKRVKHYSSGTVVVYFAATNRMLFLQICYTCRF